MELTPKVVLNLVIDEQDSGAKTVRQYFQLLLKTLFTEDEGFSGKRPFGNSGWQSDFARELIKAGVPIGTLDNDGYVESLDGSAFDDLVWAMIDEL